jgi:hypothetical protein
MQVFVWALCQDVPNLLCQPGAGTTSSARLGLDQSCGHNYGEKATVSASLVDAFGSGLKSGIKVSYAGGQACGANQLPSYTQFTVLCDPDTPGMRYGSPPLDVSWDKCGVYYNLYSAAGCGYTRRAVVPSVGAGWIVFLVFAGLFLTYLVGGIIYKKVKFGSGGLEAIPHIDFWRSAFARFIKIITCNRFGYVRANNDQYTDMDATGGSDSFF